MGQKWNSAYELLKEEELTELQSTGYILKHIKSGARVAVIKNQDENKVFSIGFRTPPANSTGVAHIIEHTVLCGSELFPSKDPFVELVKGSLNTFLNAMTYPDRTLYPVASCNDKDFGNLMQVYMDAVFRPNIYHKKEIFLQEGWHYELSRREDDLIYNGVVYNEMKGAVSSPDDYQDDLIQEALFPDLTYRYSSGGNPEVIPELSYEEFLNFHRTYYHPSNSYIYLYGDMEADKYLEWMDREYLSGYDRQTVNSEIPYQAPVSLEREDTYAVTEGSGEEGKTYLSYSLVTGETTDQLSMLAVRILKYVLLDVPGAPLKKALLDAGIGKDISSSLDTNLHQPVLTITSKNAEASLKDCFREVLTGEIKKLAEQGIDKKALLSALNIFEFRYREANFGMYPKGLMYGLQMYESWFYDDSKVFSLLQEGKLYEKLRGKAEEGWFEQKLREFFLENPHNLLLVLKPESGKNERQEKLTAEKLAAYKASLNENEIEELIRQTEALHEFEERPSTQEELLKIPMLEREDIGRKTQPLYNKVKQTGGCTVIHHQVFTNDIVYLRLLFDSSEIPEEELMYLGLLSAVLGCVDTEHYAYTEFTKEVNLYTGGIYTTNGIYTRYEDADAVTAAFEVIAKSMTEQTGKLFELAGEMLLAAKFDEEKRLREILEELRSRMEAGMLSSGNGTAVGRGLSYVSRSGVLKDKLSGVGYYRFIADITGHFDEKKAEVIEKLKSLANKLFCRGNLIVSVTADDAGCEAVEKQLEAFMNRLRPGTQTAAAGLRPVQAKLMPVRRQEGFKTSGKVQYVARTGNFAKIGLPFTGLLRILNVILSYDYMWIRIRVKGGAYGCMCGFGADGDSYLVSYRDPNLAETNQVYMGIPEYLRTFEVSERDMTKYIIGTISNLDTPLTPVSKGTRSMIAYLRGMDEKDYQRERDEILNAGAEGIRSLAGHVEALLEADCLCTVGSGSKIEAERSLFETVEDLY